MEHRGSKNLVDTIIGILIILVLIILFVVPWTRRRHYAQENIRLTESVTSFDRGTASERDLTLALLKSGISHQAIFHDLYVKKTNGHFSQIDLVVATKVGIIVFEVKDYSGWIFGNGNHSQWTQVLAYGKQKYRFYNPIKQNNRHIMELRKQLRQFEKIPFYSVIVFDGDCELRDISFVPDGTFITKSYRVLDVVDNILNGNKPANYTDKQEIVRTLRKAVENGDNAETRILHAENVRDMLGQKRIFE